MQLRPYQSSTVERAIAALPRNPCVVAPTGAGKTTIAAELVRRLGVPTLWLAHRRELIQQAAARLRGFGLSVGVIMAGEPRFGRCPVQVASVQTLLRRGMPAASVVVIDEAHHTPGDGFRRVLSCYENANRIGFTATPFRLDGQGLGELFGELIVAAHADELVAAGTLIEPKVYAPPAADVADVKKRGGDFELSALARACDKQRLIGDVVATWKKHAAGRKTVLFAVNVLHSRHIIESFRGAGVRAEHLDGQTPKHERDAALRRLAVGETAVLSNCQVLTEGWDLPALECAIIARPTASLCLHLQMVGRIMRSCEGKSGAIVLDHAGNFLRHGRVTQRLEYSLDGGVRPAGSASHGLRTCPVCYRMVLASRAQCPDCGLVFATLREAPKHEDGELQELTPHDKNATSDEKHAFFRAAAEEAAKNGYAAGWTLWRFKERFGHWPVTVDVGGVLTLVDPSTSDPSVQLAVLEKFEQDGTAKGYKPGYAAARYHEFFGHWPRFKRRRAVVA